MQKLNSVSISKTSLFLKKDDLADKGELDEKINKKYIEFKNLKKERKFMEKENLKLKNRIMLFDTNDEKIKEKMAYIKNLILSIKEKKKCTFLKNKNFEKLKIKEEENRKKQNERIKFYKQERKYMKEKYLSQKNLKNKFINEEAKNLKKNALNIISKANMSNQEKADHIKKAKSLGKFFIDQYHLHQKNQVYLRMESNKKNEKKAINKNKKLMKKYKKCETIKLQKLQNKKNKQDVYLKEFKNMINLTGC